MTKGVKSEGPGLRLHNTLTRRVELLDPCTPGKVNVYGCGPTIYDRAHIGNFRTFITYDLLHRYLLWRGCEVRFVVNLTDVDDKTIRRAQEDESTLVAYTAPFEVAFLDDADALGILRFHSYPRATDHIEAMVRWVERLVDNGLAYAAEDGSVYFRIASFPEYGRLSGARTSDAPVSSRIDADEYDKDDARDFVLWKATRPGEAEVGARWESPWGAGRPGWHLECSVMSIVELGETIDLHLGGEDLIFPHHDNEIAQSEGVTGHTFVRHWMHIKHLLSEGKKMSKSLGNFYTIRELLGAGHSAAAIRHQLLSAHYRKELNFTIDGLTASASAVQRLLDFDDRLRSAAVRQAADVQPSAGAVVGGEGVAEDALEGAVITARDAFQAAMDDDLNSAQALAALFVFVTEGNSILDAAGDVVPPAALGSAIDLLESLDRVLGIIEVARRDLVIDDDTTALVERLVQKREAARAARDWDEADRIRSELTDRGIVLEDSPQGTRWKLTALASESE